MCRTKKCALGRSELRMWQAASSVGCRERAAMAVVRVGLGAWVGGRSGGGRVRRWAYRVWKVGYWGEEAVLMLVEDGILMVLGE